MLELVFEADFMLQNISIVVSPKNVPEKHPIEAGSMVHQNEIIIAGNNSISAHYKLYSYYHIHESLQQRTADYLTT